LLDLLLGLLVKVLAQELFSICLDWVLLGYRVLKRIVSRIVAMGEISLLFLFRNRGWLLLSFLLLSLKVRKTEYFDAQLKPLKGKELQIHSSCAR